MSFFNTHDHVLRNAALEQKRVKWDTLVNQLTNASIPDHAFYILATARRQYRSGAEKIQVTVPLCWIPNATDFSSFTTPGLEIENHELYETVFMERSKAITNEANVLLKSLLSEQFGAPFILNVRNARLVGTETGFEVYPPVAEFISSLPDYKSQYTEKITIPSVSEGDR